MKEDPPVYEGDVVRIPVIVREAMILASVHRAGSVALYIEYLS